MKKLTVLSMMAFGLAGFAMAEDFKGYIEDSNCAAKPAMKGNVECAQKCLKGGATAVLVTPEGKIYKISNQDKVVAHAGHDVTLKGSAKDDTITVESVEMN